MNRERICRSLQDDGYDAALTDGGSRLTVVFEAGGRLVKLVHFFPEELLRVPRFDLVDGHGFGKLAHVLASGDHSGEGGEVCIGDVASTSINVDCPELVYRDTLEEHVLLLTRLIEDPAYNRDEQLREFDAHWSLLCAQGVAEMYVAWDGLASEGLEVKPGREKPDDGIRSSPIVMAAGPAEDARSAALRKWVNWGSRPTWGQGIGVRLDCLEPAPASAEGLQPWYFEAVERADTEGRRWLKRLGRKRSREFWVILSGDIPDGQVLFAVLWRSPTKAGLPSSVAEAQMGRWTPTAYRVRSLSRGSLVPRGGGSLDLGGKSVLLVGCGSVGSEIAHRLTSAGVGSLTISDPDRFSEENLYRHTHARRRARGVVARADRRASRAADLQYPVKRGQHAAMMLHWFSRKFSIGDRIILCRGYAGSQSVDVRLYGLAVVDGEVVDDRTRDWWRLKRRAVLRREDRNIPKDVFVNALGKRSLLKTIHRISEDQYEEFCRRIQGI